MKNLMIYEAFKSDTINKINKFLNKKVGEKESVKFVSELGHIVEKFDFPLSEIKEDNVEYLNKNKALKIRTPKDWKKSLDNKDYDIYALKFWFSLEKGYLGYTGIGKLENNYGGKIVDYEELENGEEVFCEIGNKTVRGKILKKNNSNIYLIQDIFNGTHNNIGIPEGWGDFAWQLYNDVVGKYTDHKNLFKVNKNKTEKLNPYNYNFSVDLYNLKVINSNIKDSIKDSDFCIVLYIDDVLKSGYKPVSKTRKERKESTSGATAFLTDKQIKNLNIERYFSKILKSMGVHADSEVNDLKKLEKILKISICDEFPIYSLFSFNTISFIQNIVFNLSKLIENKSIIRFGQIKDSYKSYKKNSIILKKSFKINEKKFLKDHKLSDVFKIYKEINEEITFYIKNIKVDTLGELYSISLKFEYIKKLLESDVTGNLETINHIKYMNDDQAYKLLKSDKFLEDIEKLKKIKKYIKSILN